MCFGFLYQNDETLTASYYNLVHARSVETCDSSLTCTNVVFPDPAMPKTMRHTGFESEFCSSDELWLVAGLLSPSSLPLSLSFEATSLMSDAAVAMLLLLDTYRKVMCSGVK